LAVLLISEEPVSSHFACELVGYAYLFRPSYLDRASDRHGVLGCKVNSVGRLLRNSIVRLVQLKLSDLSRKLVSDSRSVLGVG